MPPRGITVRLTDSNAAWLPAYAEATCRSQASVVNEALARFRASPLATPPGTEPKIGEPPPPAIPAAIPAAMPESQIPGPQPAQPAKPARTPRTSTLGDSDRVAAFLQDLATPTPTHPWGRLAVIPVPWIRSGMPGEGGQWARSPKGLLGTAAVAATTLHGLFSAAQPPAAAPMDARRFCQALRALGFTLATCGKTLRVLGAHLPAAPSATAPPSAIPLPWSPSPTWADDYVSAASPATASAPVPPPGGEGGAAPDGRHACASPYPPPVPSVTPLLAAADALLAAPVPAAARRAMDRPGLAPLDHTVILTTHAPPPAPTPPAPAPGGDHGPSGGDIPGSAPRLSNFTDRSTREPPPPAPATSPAPLPSSASPATPGGDPAGDGPLTPAELATLATFGIGPAYLAEFTPAEVRETLADYRAAHADDGEDEDEDEDG